MKSLAACAVSCNVAAGQLVSDVVDIILK